MTTTTPTRIGKTSKACQCCSGWNTDFVREILPTLWGEPSRIVFTDLMDLYHCKACGVEFLLRDGNYVDRSFFEKLVARGIITKHDQADSGGH